MSLIFDDAGIIMRPWSHTERDFTLEAIPHETYISDDSNFEVEVNDLLMQRHESAIVDNEYYIRITPLNPESESYGYTLESFDESIATVDQATRNVIRVSDGTTQIKASNPYVPGRLVEVAVSRESQPVHDTPIRWLDGWLAPHIDATIREMLVNKIPAEAIPVFSEQDHINRIYLRNSNFWAKDLDFTSASPGNSYDGPRRAGTLILPGWVLFSTHYPVPQGTEIWFVDNNNNTHTTTLGAPIVIPNSDFTIYPCTPELPESITPATVMPFDTTNYLPSTREKNVPCIHFDQEEHAFIVMIQDISAGYEWLANPVDDPTFGPWNEFSIPGDSGDPSFLPINNKAVLMGLARSSAANQFVGDFIPAIESAIGESLIVADLGSFERT